MDGILIIDKPAGITSHDVVASVRRILKTKRVGHTGTLDPFATGVMALVVGRATRLAQFLDKDEKQYEALVRFGFETDTGDATGMQNAECTMQNTDIVAILSATNWNAVFEGFRGGIEQIPPMYSAKKIDGKKLYEHARKGELVERKPSRVIISTLELADPARCGLNSGVNEIRIRIACSAGTYIRTLAEDIGRKVGVGAHLAELRRTRSGRFELSESITLDDMNEMDDPASKLLPLEMAVEHLPSIMLNDDRAEKTRNGLSTRIVDGEFSDGQAIRILDESGSLLAVGIYDGQENTVRPKVVLI